MGVQGFFQYQTYLSDIYDISHNLLAIEYVHYTRQGISNNDFAHTHKYKGLLEDNTIIKEGYLVIDNVNSDKYLVTAVRKTHFANQANMWRCDDTCSVYRLTNKYVGTQITGKELKPIITDADCVQKDTNGKIKFFDASLLESTIKIVYFQQSAEVKVADRLVIDGKPYQVDSVDSASVKGIYALQLSEDKRKL